MERRKIVRVSLAYSSGQRTELREDLVDIFPPEVEDEVDLLYTCIAHNVVKVGSLQWKWKQRNQWNPKGRGKENL
jgi:hypothetical protein